MSTLEIISSLKRFAVLAAASFFMEVNNRVVHRHKIDLPKGSLGNQFTVYGILYIIFEAVEFTKTHRPCFFVF